MKATAKAIMPTTTDKIRYVLKTYTPFEYFLFFGVQHHGNYITGKNLGNFSNKERQYAEKNT